MTATTTGTASAEPGNILDEITASLNQFVVFTRQEDAWLLAAWIAHTHMYKELGQSPRLLLTAAQYKSGKSECAKHVARLSYKGARVLGGALTMPQLRGVVTNDEVIGTPLFDEIQDKLKFEGESRSALMSIFKDGYEEGASMLHTAPNEGSFGGKSELINIFGPVGFVGNDLPLSAEEQSRALTIRLRRATGKPPVYDKEKHDVETERLHGEIVRWSDSVRSSVRADVTLPEGVWGRDRQMWQPLKRVAVKAGGAWPDRIDDLATEHVEQSAADAEDGLEEITESEQLVRDVLTKCYGSSAIVSDVRGGSWLKTSDAVPILCGGYSVWKPDYLTATKFGLLMREQGLRVKFCDTSTNRRQRGWKWPEVINVGAELGFDFEGSDLMTPYGGSSDPGTEAALLRALELAQVSA